MTSNIKPLRLFYGWVVLAGFFMIACAAWGVSQGAFGVFMSPITSDMEWSRTQVSAAFSINIITFSTCGIFWGWLSDRWSVKGVVAICGLLAGLGVFLTSTTQGLWQFYIYYGLIFGMGLGGFVGPLTAIASRWFGPRTGLAVGISFSGIGIGTAVLPVFAEYLISSNGWRFGFQGLSYVMWGCFLLGVLVIREPRSIELPFKRNEELVDINESKNNVVNHGNTIKSSIDIPLPVAVRSRSFWVLLAMMMMGDLVLFMILVHLAARAIDVGITAEVAATLITVTGIGKMAGLAGGGALGDRFGHRKIFGFSLILLAIAMVWLIVSVDLWMLYLFAIAFGLGNGGWSPQIPAITASIYGTKYLGAIFGAIAMGVGIGGILGPILAGYVFDSTGSYTIAFSIAAVMALVGASFPLLIKKNT